MLKEGFIKMYRSLLEWEWYQDINTKTIFIHLLLTANYEERPWQGKTILRGQRITSYQKLAEETNMSIQNVRTAIKHLISTGEITSSSQAKYSLITVKNYDKFQELTGNLTNSQQGANKELTSNQQATNNNERKKKKDKESKKDNNNNKVSDSCVDDLQKANDSCVNDLQAVVDFYNNNIGMITPYTVEVLEDYAKDMSVDLMILAMKKSVEANKRTIQYIKGILNNWNKKGIKNVSEAQKEDNKFKNQTVNEKQNSYNNYEQRQYSDEFLNDFLANVKEQ